MYTPLTYQLRARFLLYLAYLKDHKLRQSGREQEADDKQYVRCML